MANLMELEVSVNMSLADLKDVIALINLGVAELPDDEHPKIVAELSTLYFNLIEEIMDAVGDFQVE